MANSSGVIQGQTTVATASAQIATGQPNSSSSIALYAHSGNTSTLYVGGASTVTATTGFALEPGKSLQVNVNNIDELWVIASGGSPKVSWLSA